MSDPTRDESFILRRGVPARAPSVRLFCFHHAGGSAAAFNAWAQALGEHIDVCAVQTPGRENLFLLPRHRRVASLAREIAPKLSGWLDRPFAFFGHSLGALVAFAVAELLFQGGGPAPKRLLVSGCRPPHLPRARTDLSNATEEDLIAALRELGSNSLAALEHRELRELMLPVLRDDLAMAETYRIDAPRPLPCAISAFGGLEDVSTDASALRQWSEYTEGAFSLRLFPGRHFFTEQSRQALLEAIRADLSASVRSDVGVRQPLPVDGSGSDAL
jgi:medium-chain acyl-[acyl-carrier-protein] hydrolase